jgi:hypothetical protein
MNAGWIGAIIGCTIGLIAGLIGTYCSIKNTDGPKEKSFMIKAIAVGWAIIVLSMGLLFILPYSYWCLLWIPYSVLLPPGIICGNKMHQRIRQEDLENRGVQVQ